MKQTQLKMCFTYVSSAQVWSKEAQAKQAQFSITFITQYSFILVWLIAILTFTVTK